MSSSHSLLANTVDNLLDPNYPEHESAPEIESYAYDLYGSSISPTASLSVNSSDVYPGVSTNHFMLPGDVNSAIPHDHTNPPTYDPCPYDYGSPSTSGSTYASPVGALETLDSSSESIAKYPAYGDYPTSTYDGVGDASPSNTSFPETSSPSASNTSFLVEALGYFLFLFGEGEPTFEETNLEQGVSGCICQEIFNDSQSISS